MIVARLELADYRNYTRAEIDLTAGPTVFLGSNGQGKTNLVEALAYVSTGRSHRITGDDALVRRASEEARVTARVEHGGRSVIVRSRIRRRGSNSWEVGGAPAKAVAAQRWLDTVVFAPEDLAIVRGEPSHRRRFIDQLVIDRWPRMSGVINDYERTLRQRNTLLKSARAGRVAESALSTLDAWDAHLVRHGSQILAARYDLVTQLQPRVTAAYRSIAGADHTLTLTIRSTVDGAVPDDDEQFEAPRAVSEQDEPSTRSAAEIAPHLATAIAAARDEDLRRGLSRVGPHRDDIHIELNELPARGYASHGESWSVALALKLAAASVLRETSPGGDPVLILDDVFAELDADRRNRLADAIADFEQVLVTTAVGVDVPDRLAARIVPITAGTIALPDDEATS